MAHALQYNPGQAEDERLMEQSLEIFYREFRYKSIRPFNTRS
jgi:hypothetical protein